MTTLRTRSLPPLARTERSAVEHALEVILRESRDHTASITVGGAEIDLPEPVRAAVVDLMRRMAHGEPVVLTSAPELLTTSQAADLLGISRTYLCTLVDREILPAEFRGTHRRLRVADVMAYAEKMRAERRVALDDVAAVSHEAGLYDDDF